MAVAETTCSQGKKAGQTTRTARAGGARGGAGRPSLLALSTAIALAFMSTLMPVFIKDARAQVKADASAPKTQQPTVLNSANGTLQVNIRTPSAAGVSRNTYSQFDIDRSGVILNNSRVDTSTQIGGWVQANPWLAQGGARVILNEVNSSAPSQLKGYIEVAGQRADVVIANPSGIQVDGAGFINASSAVLTTGTTRFNADGSIGGFAVQGGLIRIDGQGLDGSQADYTALLARAVELNAGLWAKDARVQTGVQLMTADLSGPPSGNEALAPAGAAPRYAIDSTSLGGIYAQRITLVGTEAGLGVRQAGQIIGGQLRLRADGWLENTGTVYAQEPDASGAPALAVSSGQGVRNAGWMASNGSVAVSAPQIEGLAGSVTVAGMALDGTVIAGTGSLSLVAEQSNRQAGQLQAGGRIDAQAPSVDFSGVQAQAAAIGVSGSGGLGSVLAQDAVLVATNRIDVSAGASTDLARAQLQANTITLSAPVLGADGVVLSVSDALSVTATRLSSVGATFAAGKLSVAATDADLRQAQWMQLGGEALALRFDGTVNADGARIASNGSALAISAGQLSGVGASIEQYGTGALALDARTADLSGAKLWAAGALSAQAAQLTLDGATLQAQSIALHADGDLSQRGAVLGTPGTVSLSADRIDNRNAQVAADGGITVQAGTQLLNDGGQLRSDVGGITIGGQADISSRGGLIAAHGAVSVVGHSLIQQGGASIAGQDVTLSLQGAFQQDGDSSTSASGSLSIEAQSITVRGQLSAGAALSLSGADSVALAGSVYGGRVAASSGGDLTVDGLFAAQGDLSATATRQLQGASTATIAAGLGSDGRVGAQGTLVLSAGNELGMHGQFLAVDASISAARIDITGAQGQAAGALHLQSSGALVSEGAVLQAGSLSLQAQDWLHAGGQLAVSGTDDLNVAVTGKLDNRQGAILANSRTALLAAQDIDNSGGRIAASGNALQLQAQTLTNQGGTVTTLGDLHVVAPQIDNRDGELSGEAVEIHGDQLNNTGSSLIAAAQNLSLQANALVNEGTLQAHADATIAVTGALSNSGLIRAMGAATIDAGTLAQTGTAAAGGSLAARAAAIDSSGTFAAGLQSDGTLGTLGDLALSATQSLKHSGTILAAGAATLDGADLQLQGSRVQAALVSAQARSGELRLDGATMVAAGPLDLRAASMLGTEGARLSGSSVDVAAADWRNAGGQISQTDVAGHLTATLGGTLDNTGGRIVGNGTALTLSAGLLSNTQGLIAQAGTVGGELRIDVGTLSGAKGQILGNGGLTLNAGSAIDLGQAATQADRITIHADSMTLQGGQVLANSAVQLTAAGALDNTGGLVQGGGPVALQAATLVNRDGQIGGAGVTLRGGALDNAGQGLVASTAGLSIDMDRVNNAGAFQSAGDIALSARSALDNAGLVYAQGNAQVNAGDMTHTGMLAAQGRLSIQADTLTSSGTLAAGLKADNTLADGGDLSLAARQLQHSGTAVAGGELTLTADSASLQGSQMQAQQVTMSTLAGDLHLDHAAVSASDRLNLSAAGALDSAAAMLSAGSLSITATDWHNAGGNLAQTATGGDLHIAVTGLLANQAGSIGANAASASLTAGQVDNRGGDITHAGSGVLALTTGTLTGDDGRIASAGTLALVASCAMSLDRAWTQGGTVTLEAGSLSHRQGQLLSLGSAALAVVGALDNTGGLLQATGELQARAGSLVNDDGRIDGRSVQLRANGLMSNAGQGLVTAAQSLGIEAGQLDNAGALQSQGAATLDVAGAMSNHGTVYAQGAATVTVGGALTHSGSMAAQGALTVKADSIASSGVFAAGLKPDNTMDAQGDLMLSATQTLQHSGLSQAAGNASLEGASLQLQGSQTVAATVALNARNGELRLDGALVSTQGLLGLNTAAVLNTEGAQLSGGSIDIVAADWRNAAGSIGQTDAHGYLAAAIGGSLDNAGGRIAANGTALTLQALSLDNTAGQIVHAGASSGELRIDTGALSGAKGQILGNGGLTLNASGAADLSQATTQADRIALQADSLSLQGGQVLAATTVDITATGALDNTGGLVQGGGSVALQAATLINRDGQIGGAGVTLRGGELTNAGQGLVASTAGLSIEMDRVNNAGALQAAGDIALSARTTLDNTGLIYAQGNAQVQADALTHTGLLAAQGSLAVSARTIDSSGEFAAGLKADNTIAATGDLTLMATGQLHHSGAAIAGDALSISGAGLALQDGQFQAQRITLNALSGGLSLNQASVASSRQLVLSASGQLDTSAAVLSGGSVVIDAANWRHAGGQLAQTDAAGTLQVAVAGLLDNQGGKIAANAAAVTLTAATLDNRGGSLMHAGTDTLALKVQELDGNGGQILGNGLLSVQATGAALLDGALTQAGIIELTAASLSHRGGQMAGQDGVTLNVTGGLDNSGGVVQSAKDLQVGAGSLDNQDGQLGGQALRFDISGRLANGGQGLIAAGQTLAIAAGQLDNAGSLQSQAAMDLSVQGSLGNAGTVYARGPLTVSAGGALTQTGMMAAQGDVSVQADSIASSGGFVAGLNADNTFAVSGDLVLRAAGTLQQSGQVVAAGLLTASGASLQWQDARVQAKQASLTATSGDLRLDRATLAASGALVLTSAGTLDTRAATVDGASVAISAQSWSNAGGVLSQTEAGGSLNATLQGALDNTSGSVAAAGRTLAINAASVDNTVGRIVHAGSDPSGSLRIDTGTLTGVGGQILGAQAVTLEVSGAADLRQAQTQGAQLVLDASSLQHQGGQLLSSGDVRLQVTGSLDNTGGALVAAGDLHAQAATLVNTAGQIGGHGVDLAVGTLTNGGQGLVSALGALTIGADQIDNAGTLQSGGDTRLVVTNNVDNSGAVYAQDNASLTAGGVLNLGGTLASQGALTVDAGTVSGSGTLAAGLRPDNSMAAQGEMTVHAAGTLQFSGAMLAAGRMALSGQNLQLQDSRSDVGSAALSATSGSLRLDRAVLGSRGDLALSSAGLLSTDGATLSGANVGLTATDWSNAAGSLTQTGSTGQLTATVGGALGNAGGRIQAAGAGMTMQAQSVDNTGGVLMQAGTGGLTMNTGSLTGSSGQILSSGALTISATGALALDGAQTQGQGVSLSGASLDHRGGNLLSTGAEQLRIDGAIDNRGGTIASAGALDVQGGSLANGSGANGNVGLLQSGTTLQASFNGALDNHGGRLRSGAAMTLSALSLDNSAGSVGSEGSLDVNTAGALLNAGGSLLAQQGMSADVASLGNQQGQIASLQGDIRLQAQGGIDNTQGRIQAAQTAMLTSSSLTNVQGQVSGAAVSIDTRGQALDNRGGQLLATQSLAVDSGALDNTGGLLQSLGDLSIQTRGAALTNALDTSVATPTGIRAQGTLSIDSGALFNGAGISTAGNAQISASDLTNRADLAAANLSLAVAGTLDNQTGRLIGTSSLAASAQQVLNQGGLIYGGESLSLSVSGRIDNTNTASAGLGIQGGNVVLQALQLANAGGQVLANGNLGLTIGQSLDNGGGTLGAGGAQTIGDGANVSALALNNASGKIWSGNALSLNLAQLAGGVGGQISSGGSLSLALQGDFSYGAGSQFQSAGDTVLSLSGNFSNQGTLRSGGTLAITAANIDNAGTGELSGAATVLTASGTLNNRGLIDGDIVGLQADQVLNVGTGRIYGGDIVITSGRLANGAEGGTAAVIAARRSLDAALTQDLSNTGGALIYADGDLRIAGTSLLNENSTIQASSALVLQMSGDIVNRTVLQGVGSGLDSSAGTAVRTLQVQSFISSGGDMAITAANLTNSGATIEARGNLALSAGRIDNLNPYLMWRVSPNLSDPYVEIEYSTRPPMLYEEYATNVPLNGQTADQVIQAWQAQHRNMNVSRTQVYGDEDPATVSQSLAANIIVGGTLQVQGTTITNDMSRVVGENGVSISAGTVNNIDHQVTVTDPNTGKSLAVKLVLPGTAQSFIPAASTPGDRAQAGSAGTGGGASAQQVQSAGRAAPSDGAGLDSPASQQAQALQAGSAAQSGATAGTGWRSGAQLAAQAVDAPGSSSGAGAVQARLRSGTGPATKTINSAQAADTTVSAQADVRQSSTGTAAQVSGAQDVQGAQATAQLRDGSTASAQAVSSVQTGDAALAVQGGLRNGRSAVAQALGAAQAAQSGASAQAQGQATAQAGTVSTSAAQALRRPAGMQGSTPQGGSTGSSSSRPLALSVQVKLTVPNNSLLKTHPEPSSSYLVETDPRFADYKDWVSSDYLLEALSLDPTTTQKRLGDGFYEQQLVREQIGELTGTSYLPGYSNDEDEYRALLTNGATFAQEHQLVPGVALTAEQMTQLTSDLVWLVEQDVTLPDGTVQQVLVPQVYLVPRDGDLLPSGALIAGDRVQMALSGSLNNDGSIRSSGADGVVDISAQDIANTGDVRGTTLALSAQGSLSSLGGQLAASGDLSLSAGQDIDIASTTRDRESSHGATTARSTVLDQVASLSAGGVIVLQAGGDVTLQAVQLSQGSAATDNGAAQGADGGIVIQAGHDITLGTLQTSSSRDTVYSATNYSKHSQTLDEGTTLQAQGAITLQAGQDLSATAADISSAQGAVTLAAGRDVSLLAGQATQDSEQMTKTHSSGLFSSKTTTTYSKSDQTTAVGTTVSGATLGIQAGQDITVNGSNVVSDAGTLLSAGRDVSITDAVNNLTSEQMKQTVKSGLLTGGGIGITLGTRELKQNQDHNGDTAAASTIAAIDGDVTIQAGRGYSQVGSNVSTPGGNIDITAQTVSIVEAREKAADTSKTEFKQSGLTVALSVPGVSGLMDATQAAQMAERAEDPRMKALALATAAAKISDALQAMEQFKKAADAGEAGKSISLSLTVGGSQATSTQTNDSDHGAASSVTAGGNVSIVAVGAGQDSNLIVRGSGVSGSNVQLKADNQVSLQASADTSEQHSDRSSVSAGVGVAISLGDKTALGYTANASMARGNSDGSDQSYANTHITATNQVSITSGGDTMLQGAVVKGDQVVASVGGGLTIQSLQDSAKFDSKDQSGSVSATVGAGAGASLSLSQTKVGADFLSVNEQSGIKAGDGGFKIDVKGNTGLQGGAITSSQVAIDGNRNSLTTGSLSASDLENHSRFDASSISVSVGTGGGSAGAFQASGNDTSTTRSSISQGAVTITTGDQASQQALASVDRSATNASTGDGLKQNWDGQDLAAQAGLNAQIVQAFGAEASKQVGDYAASKTKPHDDAALYLALKGEQNSGQLTDPRLQKQLSDLEASGMTPQSAQQTLNDPQVQADYDNWKEGGAYRVAAHAVVGGITGDASGLGAVQGAAGAGASQAAIPFIADQVLNSAVPDDLKKTLIGAAGAAVGAMVGNGAGAIGSFNATENNFLKHPQAAAMNKELNACKAKAGGCSTEDSDKIFDKYRQLSDQNIAQVQSCIFTGDVSCVSKQLGDAAMPGEVLNTALSSTQEKVLYAREMNAISGSVAGNRASNSADVQLAQQVAQFRQSNCADPASSACDAQVAQAMQNTQLAALKLVGAAFATGPVAGLVAKTPAAISAAVNAIRGCAANPVLCVNTAGIVAADVAADGAIGVGALAAGASKVTGSVEAAVQDAKTVKAVGSPLGSTENLENAATSARTQPYGNGQSASPSPGAQSAGSPGQNIQLPDSVSPQRARASELTNLFDKSNPSSDISLGGQTFTATAESNKVGTTKVFDTSAVPDAQLEAQARTYVNELTGGTQLTPKGNPPQVWTTVLSDGSTVTLRSVSSSTIGTSGTQARWTVEIFNNQSLQSLLPKAPKFEIKFK